MRVLIIPEDFRKDQYILKPIITAMLKYLDMNRAKVIVCTDPLLGGVSQALKWKLIQEILEIYKNKINLFLLIVDRDGEEGRRKRLDQLEQEAKKFLGPKRLYFAENAWQEVEVWVLAGHDLPNDWQWKTIRSERDPKERYYEPFAKLSGVWDQLAEGRKTLAEEAACRYTKIRQRCPEDIKALENKIQQGIPA